MARVSKNLGFTVPPRMAEEFERVAEEEGSTKSELFRRMFRLYQSYRTPISAHGQSPDAWVERLIVEAQEEERRRPITAEAWQHEMDELTLYGAERATALGVTSEEDVDRIVYATRQGSR